MRYELEDRARQTRGEDDPQPLRWRHRVGHVETQQRPTRRNEQQNPAAEPPQLWTPLCRSSHQSRLPKLWRSHPREDPLKWQERQISYSFFSRRRHYASLKLNSEQSGSLLLTLAPRAVAACDDAVNEFCKDVPVAVRNQKRNSALDVSMSRDEWTTMAKPLGQLLSAIVDGWKRSAADN